VFKETSSTTRTRVVFDGSAKSSNGLSLNDLLQVGPTVQPDLYSTVLRFRTYQVCFTADIAKMYRQIIIHPQDRNLQRILWRHSSEQPIQEYQLTTVTYGTSAAPFLATRCLKKLADDSQDNYPRVAQALSKIYIEDLLSKTITKKASQQLMGQLPSARVQPARPFTTTGIDYAAPIITTGSTRSKQTVKGYIAIIVCSCDTGCPH